MTAWHPCDALLLPPWPITTTRPGPPCAHTTPPRTLAPHPAHAAAPARLPQNTIWVLNDWDQMCKRKYFGKLLHMLNAKSYTEAFDDISLELFMAFQVGWGGWGG